MNPSANTRLQEIARNSGAPRYQVPPRLSLPPLPRATINASPDTLELLARLRTSQPGYKHPDERFSRHFKTKSQKEKQRDITTWKYDIPELSAALDHAVHTNQPLAVVQDLIRRHAAFDIHDHLPVAVQRNDLALTTIILRDPEAANHLAVQSALNSLLHRIVYDVDAGHAVPSSQLDILQALLAVESRLESCMIGGTNALAILVDGDHLGLVQTLLRSCTGIPSAVLSACLLNAARSASVGVTGVLLAYGANPGYDGAAAVLAAVRHARYDIAATILAHSQYLVPVGAVSAALELVLTTISSSIDHEWLDLLLVAGADSTTRTLTRRLATAVERADSRTIKLLVDAGVSISQCDFKPLRAAMIRRSLRDMELLLSGGTCTREAAVLVPILKDHFSDEAEELDATRLLIGEGVRGSGLDERLLSLVESIVTEHRSVKPRTIQRTHVDVLMDGGASFGHDRGRALKVAVGAANICLVQLACKQRLGVEVLSGALLSIYEHAPARAIVNKAAVLEPILAKGVSTNALDETLDYVITYQDWSVELCRTLTSYKAKVTSSEQLINTINQLGDDVYSLLVGTVPTRSIILDHTLPHTLTTLSKARIVLSQGCSQKAVDDLLLVELQTSTPRTAVVELLLEFHASVNQYAGKPLVFAASRPEQAILSLLLGSKPNQDSLGAAFVAMTLTQHTNQMAYCEVLLAAGLSQKDLDVGLCNLARTSDQARRFMPMIGLLLAHGASVNYNGGEVLRRQIGTTRPDVLGLLLSRPVAPDVISAAFEATQQLRSDSISLAVLPLLFEASSERIPGVDRALVNAARADKRSSDLIELLLEQGASASWNNAEALRESIQKHDTTTLARLLQPPPERQALESCMTTAAQQQGSRRLDLIQMLLEAGADETEASDVMLANAICQADHGLVKLILANGLSLGPRSATSAISAAAKGDIETLKILVPVYREYCTQALDAIRANSPIFTSSKGTESVRLILGGITSQQSRDEALLAAVAACRSGHSCEALVTLLLNHAADVSGCDGQSLSVAAQHQSTTIFKQLLGTNPSARTVAKAVPLLIRAGHDEAALLDALSMCFRLYPTGPGNSRDEQGENSVVVLITRLYPTSLPLLKAVLDQGYVAPTDLQVSLDPEISLEVVSFLIWTVWRVPDASREVLAHLVDRTDIHTSSAASMTSPLIAAVLAGNAILVELLLSTEVDLAHVDKKGRTAMYHAASREGHHLVQLLCKAGSVQDDGSLHEAVRALRSKSVGTLLDDGHSANYSCLLHGESTPLFELALRSRPGNAEERRDVTRIARRLLSAGASDTILHDGRSVIFVALLSDFPVEVLAALLETDIGNQLNAKHNLYTNEDTLCFSATMYVEHGPLRESQYRNRLVRLLKNKGCQDVYYRVNGEQPAEATGMPAHIEEKHQRLQAELERHTTIRREATLRRTLDEEARNSELRGLQDRHRLVSQQEHERTTQQQAAAEVSRNTALAHEKSMVLVAQAATDNQNKAALAHASSLAQVRQAEKERVVGLERQIMYEQEQSSNRQHERKKQLIEFENQSFQDRARTVASYARQIQAAQQYVGNSNMLQIGGGSAHEID